MVLSSAREEGFGRAAETRYRMSDNAYQTRPLLKALLALDFEGAPDNPLIEAIAKLRVFYRDDLRRLPAETDGSFAPLWQQDRSPQIAGTKAAVASLHAQALSLITRQKMRPFTPITP